jgi:DNA-binding transcriptional ArsR family regulator
MKALFYEHVCTREMGPRASDPAGPSRTEQRPTAGRRGDSRSSSPSLTDLYGILASPRRRELLRYLADYPGPVSVEELAVTLAAHARTTDAGAFEPASTERLQATLEHVDLPKLVETNIVEYDPRGDAVRRGDGFYHVAPFIDLVE